jgi:hypothetical protein
MRNQRWTVLLGDADVRTPQRTKRPDLSYLPEQLLAGRSIMGSSAAVTVTSRQLKVPLASFPWC